MNQRRVVLIIGPPGAGKTTLAERMASDEGLRHIEYEQFPYPSHVRMRAAVRAVGLDPHARAVIIRCCSGVKEQAEWETLAGATETIMLDVDVEECVRRIKARGRPRWVHEARFARVWHARRARAKTDRGVPDWFR